MPKRETQVEYRLLRLLTDLTYLVLTGKCNPPACILRARVLFLAADALGVDLQPVKARMIAGNPAYTAWVEEHGRFPEDEGEAGSLADAGIQAMGNGFGVDSKKSWGGHLVLRRGDVLLDPSAPDCNRPARGIELPPLAVIGANKRLVPGGVLSGKVDGGCMFAYWPWPEASDTWQSAPDWQRSKVYARSVRKIVTGAKLLMRPWEKGGRGEKG